MGMYAVVIISFKTRIGPILIHMRKSSGQLLKIANRCLPTVLTAVTIQKSKLPGPICQVWQVVIPE